MCSSVRLAKLTILTLSPYSLRANNSSSEENSAALTCVRGAHSTRVTQMISSLSDGNSADVLPGLKSKSTIDILPSCD